MPSSAYPSPIESSTSSPHSSLPTSGLASVAANAKVPLKAQTSLAIHKKPKQTKSRNGCSTCKAKRLKCDETKPTCEQCLKRGVECGGYKKDFKWKNFEENVFVDGNPPKRGKKDLNANGFMAVTFAEPNQSVHGASASIVDAAGENDTSSETATSLQSKSGPQALSESPPFSLSRDLTSDPSPMHQDEHLSFPYIPPEETDKHFLFSQAFTSNGGLSDIPQGTVNASDDEDDVEEIDRGKEPFEWAIKQRHITAYYANQRDLLIAANSRYPLHRTIPFRRDSQESLMHTYISQTSGILSIKDGPNENPWRTLVFPLAQSSPPLFHALASMTAFHLASSVKAESTSAPSPYFFRNLAVRHLSTSLSALSVSLSAPALPATELLGNLATTITLAFAESWDWGTRSGICHLRGSRILVSRALAAHAASPFQGSDLECLKSLANSWMYLDVLAQLTSMGDVNCSIDFEGLLAPLHHRATYGPLPAPMKDGAMAQHYGKLPIDPLLGCSRTMFPTLGRIATLCKKVRLHQIISGSLEAPLPPDLLTWAFELKAALETWDPGDISTYCEPEDDPSSVRYGLATAETYRLCTLGLLYQAVPCLDDGGDAIKTVVQLAESAIGLLDSTPVKSRVVIIQIFPLMVAGCEAKSEFRDWVRERWKGMKGRMWIGNLECCSDVVEEVWKRRDLFESMGIAKKSDYGLGGRLHWATIMREWKWEVLLA